MHAEDRVAHRMNMSIGIVDDGSAVVSMTVTADMANGLGVCHGGLLFTLADTAMAHASNAADERTFSTTAQIDWISPAFVGQRLTATSTRVSKRGKSSIHDIVITNDDGETIALVRGQTLTVGGPVAQPDTER
jgi:acyl-CoA thioesterase